MKISVEKLVANRANAQKSSGPLTRQGKLRSAKNAVKHGLSGSSNLSSNSSPSPSPSSLPADFQGYSHELTAAGYSSSQANDLVEALLNSREVIEAKHEAYADRLNEKRMSNYSIAALREYVQEMAKPGSGVTKNEMRRITMLLYYQVLKDTDTAGLLYEKFEAHRKLMRYEQRAFNQLRKKSLVKK
jgi:hypothetical protein